MNEELDPRAMIARLKLQVNDLKQGLQLATGEERSEELVEEEMDACRRSVDVYLEEKDLEARIEVNIVLSVLYTLIQWFPTGFHRLSHLYYDLQNVIESTALLYLHNINYFILSKLDKIW